MNIKLDAAVVAAAECPVGKKHDMLYDTTLTGFVLEVRKSGGKTYYIRFTNKYGKLQQVKVGRADQISCDKARKAARQLLSNVVLGGDPAAEKAQAKAVPLYAELAAQHLADAKLHCRSYDTIRGYLERHAIPRWGRVRVGDIDARDVAHWLAAKRADGLAPATVEKMRALLSRSFELGKRWGIAGCDRNPARGVPRKPLNNARERFLTAEEAGRLQAAASASHNPLLRPIVDLLMLTGARVGELLQARWEHVDVERQSWLIPKSKTGKARHVPLSGAALAVVAGLPRIDGCPWLLPNPDTGKPFVSIKHGWQAARAAAGMPELRVHDLRHSAASFMVNSGVDLFAVGKVLGHASYQSTQRYSHLASDTLLAAVEAGAAKLRPAAAPG